MPDLGLGRPLRVLLVEDDPGDALMTEEALEEHEIANQLRVVTNGEDALAYLRAEGSFIDAVMPDLVLLDLNLPRRDGREVLRAVKGDPGLRSIPVVILTTSDSDEDVHRCFDLQANAYIRKPLDFEQFLTAVRAVPHFFAGVGLLPQRP